MKLNPDCVRDILLKIEELPDVKHFWRFEKETIPDLFPQYSIDEIIYHLRQCELNGFLLNPSHNMQYDYYIVQDLTPIGHEFLNNIRENTVWNGVKEVAIKIGANSLSSFVQIATATISQLIKSHFELP